MAIAETQGALDPMMAIALVGALGVGSQWLAWRLNMPAIVLMLVSGLIIGPATGIFDPVRDIGALTGPIISLAVAVILFEGGLTLNRSHLLDAADGVRRLVFIGAPLGWLVSTLVLHYGAGLGWESSAVFGGIMIVTGPTVIAPMLRQARLPRRPAALLQWEAIVNDPIGALAAVLAYEVVLVLRATETLSSALGQLAVGIVIASGLGILGGWGIAVAFKRGYVPEYMKVPILFTVLIVVFAISDQVLHESGLLAVTVMGVWIANARLPSYEELRRFKEHATVLLVSGVFILLAASMKFQLLTQLDWRAAVFVALVVLVARPLTVLVSLAGSDLPWNERVLVGMTGPRGVVLVAVAGLFGERLGAIGVEDGALIAPLAFVLVAVTVVLHGFTLIPFARLLGLADGEEPGLLLIGGSKFSIALGKAVTKAGLPVLVTDPNLSRLRGARAEGLPVYYGDILSEAAEHSVEIISYGTVIAATDNDAYNTLVATDLSPEFGRANVFQLGRQKSDSARHALPKTLGGRNFGGAETLDELNAKLAAGWRIALTRLTEEFGAKEWRETNPEAKLLGWVTAAGELKMVRSDDPINGAPDTRLIALLPAEEPEQAN
ncbi:sodium:proton antiporter [Litorivita sp. NS0012-18]|uniref:cation:proton antiporter n=1 Tax=Litorivita sp. NS0012-18 TaxID=3127655 RepID=UPI00310AC875